MAKPGITVTWTNDMGTDLETTLATLNDHRPIPEVTTSMTFKGSISPQRVLQVIGLLESIDGMDMTVKVAATWDKGRAPNQLALFPSEAIKGRLALELADAVGGSHE